MVRLALAGCCAALLAAPAASKPKEIIPRTELSHACSRVVSRNVRKSLEKEVLRPAQKAGADGWPDGCPLAPSVDLWGKQEKQKQRKRGSGTLWTCGFCGKVFKSEHYLDLHMEHKHMNETPTKGVCLADYCEVFDVCRSETKIRSSKRGEACENATMAKARGRCEVAVSRCFPLDQPKSRTLNAKLSKEFCRVLDCRIREERRNEHHSELMPVVVLLILVALICFIVFSMVVCCVDYSDDILAFMLESRIASTGFVKSMVKARDETRKTVGLDRRQCI